MTKRALPAAQVAARPGMRSELLPSALDRWNPTVSAAAGEEVENTISVLDPIGADWFGEGVTAKRISAALRTIGAGKDVVVNINSPGGDYFEGLAIYNLLREHKGTVTIKVLGIAASAASVIAMAGDDIQIARAGFLMIHNTWVVAMGDRHQLRDVSDWLEPFDAAAVDIYAARTGIDAKDVGKMLDRETWIGGADAVEKGFADSLLAADEVATRTNNSADGRPTVAAHKLDALLAQINVPRSERRELIQALKGGTRNAAATDMPGAVAAGIDEVLQKLKSIR